MVRRHVPNALTAARVALAPVLYFCVTGHAPMVVTVGVLLSVVLTDLADGWLARRMGVYSAVGGYLDAGADLLVGLAAFAAFATLGVYPWWALGLIGTAFAAFVLTSGREGTVHDPVGRHYGTFMYVVVGANVSVPDLAVAGATLAALVCLTVVTVACRAAVLVRGVA